MRARCLLALGAVVATVSLVAAEPATRSYTLAEIRSVARAARPTIESAEAGIEAATGAQRQAGAYPNPVLVATAGRGRPRDGGSARTEMTLDLVQPLELRGVRHWRALVAELGVRGAEVERTMAESVVDAAVGRLALAVVLGRRRVEIAADGAGIAERLRDLLAHRAELGESSPLEAVKARVEWFARRREVLDAESALAAARAALNLLCDGRLGQRYDVLSQLDDREIQALPADLVERLRARNPILLHAGVAVEEAEARTESARKDADPRIDLLAGYESELDRTAVTVGVGLTIPVWNRNGGAIDAAAAEARRAALAVRTLRADLEAELARAMAEYASARAAIGLHRDGWDDSAAKALAISTFRFENGEGSLLEVLDAQRNHLAVGLDEADSRAALELARVEIERLIGGPLAQETIDEAR